MPSVKALDAAQLVRHCDPSLFSFQTTAELAGTTEIVGQARAVDAVHFGIDIQRQGYNLFVLGDPGSGRHSVVQRLLEAKAGQEAPPQRLVLRQQLHRGQQAAPAAGSSRARRAVEA